MSRITETSDLQAFFRYAGHNVTVVRLPPRSAVICEDESRVADALVRTLAGLFRFEVVTVRSVSEALAAASRAKLDLVVVDLALSGEHGLGVVPDLLAAAPECAVAVVVPAPLGTLRADALEAGAIALVEQSDLRLLRRCLEHRYTRTHPAGTCPSCPGAADASTAAALDRGRSHLRIGASGVVRPGLDGATGRSSSAPLK